MSEFANYAPKPDVVCGDVVFGPNLVRYALRNTDEKAIAGVSLSEEFQSVRPDGFRTGHVNAHTFAFLMQQSGSLVIERDAVLLDKLFHRCRSCNKGESAENGYP